MDFKRNNWIGLVTVLCFVLGMLLAAALKTQQSIRTKFGIPTTRVSGLAQALLDEKEMNKSLRGRITELLGKVDKYERNLSEGGSKSHALADELRKSKFLAGLSPAEGPGVEVTLQDSTKRLPPDTDPVLLAEYMIHDLDLRNFVNELLANGAEVISIRDKDNDQRIIATTAIRCVGGVIQVNGVPMSPPFVITALGPPNALESALKMPNGIIDQFHAIPGVAGSMVRVKRREHLEIPAYSGSIYFKYAQEVKE
ncbi:MAG: DUF881 domain-containing protein [Armatimonadota bacterium]